MATNTRHLYQEYEASQRDSAFSVESDSSASSNRKQLSPCPSPPPRDISDHSSISSDSISEAGSEAPYQRAKLNAWKRRVICNKARWRKQRLGAHRRSIQAGFAMGVRAGMRAIMNQSRLAPESPGESVSEGGSIQGTEPKTVIPSTPVLAATSFDADQTKTTVPDSTSKDSGIQSPIFLCKNIFKGIRL